MLTVECGFQPAPQKLSGVLVNDPAYIINAPNTSSSAAVTILASDPMIVSITATDAVAFESPINTGTYQIARAGDTTSDLAVNLSLSGNASASDYTLTGGSLTITGSTATLIIPAGQNAVDLTLTPASDGQPEGTETLTLTLAADPAYLLNSSSSASVTIEDVFINEIRGTFAADTLNGTVQNDRLLGLEDRDTLIGNNGDDILIGGPGGDTLTGGAGSDRFTFNSFSERSDRITDFTSGQDVIDLRGVFDALNYTGSNPIQDGYLKLVATGSSTSVQIDPDAAGAAVFRTLVGLDTVNPASLDLVRDFLIQ